MQIELNKDFTLEEVKEALKQQPGVVLYDDVKNHIYPNSIVAKDQDQVYVGRIRKDLTSEKGILLYCVADNIRNSEWYCSINPEDIKESIEKMHEIADAIKYETTEKIII